MLMSWGFVLYLTVAQSRKSGSRRVETLMGVTSMWSNLGSRVSKGKEVNHNEHLKENLQSATDNIVDNFRKQYCNTMPTSCPGHELLIAVDSSPTLNASDDLNSSTSFKKNHSFFHLVGRGHWLQDTCTHDLSG